MTTKDEALKLALEYRPTMNEEVLHSWATEMKKAAQEALAEQPAPPPECQTEAEKTAFAFGWWKALESVRQQPSQQQEPVNKYCCHLCFNKSGQMFLDWMILCPECGNKRCPKATHHDLPCTKSNDLGQKGSIYDQPAQQEPVERGGLRFYTNGTERQHWKADGSIDFKDKQGNVTMTIAAGPITSPQPSKPTDEMVVAAARVLSDRQAAACNVDCGDMWKLYGNDFIDDARAALEAAHDIKENT